ncbi:hypothetical protein C5O00_08590 [Pukyongia salina]|uniref:Helix-turn-helix domain-containing protein n=1 Tax=Pukyongia salina TaxID=2094025 RepID=A0A2S0HX70_9FLAO|nr:hypothetical protein C5O00_08590 [Pukyongia salina]
MEVNNKRANSLEITNKYLTKPECAKLIKSAPSTVDKYRRLGILQGYKIGGKILFKLAEVEAALIKV